MNDEDTNWFKTLPWCQKILVLLVGFGIAALFFLGPDLFGQINENKSQGPPEPILHGPLFEDREVCPPAMERYKFIRIL